MTSPTEPQQSESGMSGMKAGMASVSRTLSPLRCKSYAGPWLWGGPVGHQYSKRYARSGENGGADTGMRPYALGREEIPVSGGQTSTGKRNERKPKKERK